VTWSYIVIKEIQIAINNRKFCFYGEFFIAENNDSCSQYLMSSSNCLMSSNAGCCEFAAQQNDWDI